VDLRRIGFRFIALADDNFYPVTFTDLRLAREQNNTAKLDELTAIRMERFQLMDELAKLPKDMVFYTQMTMEAGEDAEFLDAMRKANIKGALVGWRRLRRRAEGGLQGLELLWRRPGQTVADLQGAWSSRAGFVHLRAAYRQAGDLRRHGGDGAERRALTFAQL